MPGARTSSWRGAPGGGGGGSAGRLGGDKGGAMIRRGWKTSPPARGRGGTRLSGDLVGTGLGGARWWQSS